MPEVIEVGLKVKGAKEAEKSIDGVSDATEGLGGSLDQASGALDKMTGGAMTAFKGVTGGLKKSVIGLKTFKGALAATGIGLLIVAVGSLVSYFTKTQRGAEMLEVATAGVQVVFAKLTDVASSVGETLSGIFSDPVQSIKDFGKYLKEFVMDRVKNLMDGIGFLGSAVSKLFKRDFAGALADAAQGVKNLAMANPALAIIVKTGVAVAEGAKDMAKEIMTAVEASTALANRAIQLRKDQRELSKSFAEGRAQIKEYNLTAEDTTQALEDRLVAAQKAIDIEKALMTERQRIAQEEVAIQKANMALTESTEEDQQKLVDLEVALINIRTESAEMQTTLNNKLNIIKAQAQAEEDQRAKAETDRLAQLDAAAKKDHDAQIKRAEERIAKEEETAKAIRAARMTVVQAGFEALKSMAKTEAGQKRLAIAQVLVNQGIAMSEAIRGAQQAAAATGPGAPIMSPIFTAQMIALVLGGFASIKGIMNQAGASTPGGGGGGVISGGGGGVQRLGLTPELGPTIPGEGIIPPVQAYVIQNDIADSTALATEIAGRSSL